MIVGLLSILISFQAQAQEPKLVYLKEEEIPALIEGLAPPAENSKALAKDIKELNKRMKKRTDEDCKEAISQQELAFHTLFAGLITQAEYDKHFDTVVNASNDLAIVVGRLKKQFARVRPIARPEIEVPMCPGSTKSKNGYPADSFPSGHAALGYLIAHLLVDLIHDPAREEAFITRGYKIGWNRSALGVHFPSDVMAGQKIAMRVYKKIKKRLHSH